MPKKINNLSPVIAYLTGLIIDKTDKSLILLVSGVGYEVFVTTGLLAEAQNEQKAHLYTHLAVKEDDMSLYGFKQKEELAFFRQLLTVSGIGPKMALEILNAPLPLIKTAIFSEDTATLTKIKGLGKKTAERLCLELKNKVDMVINSESPAMQKEIHEDAVLALESLGYERYHILKSMAKLPPNLTETEEIVKYFLKNAH